jgi:hypothetical protein
MTRIVQPQIDRSRPIEPAPAWARILTTWLGYPPDLPLERHITDERGRWIRADTDADLGAWKFDIIGIPICSLPDDPNEQPDVYAYGYRTHPDEPQRWVRAMVTRVHLRQSEVFVERSYRADGTVREDICGVNTCEPDGIPFARMILDAEKALAVLGATFPRGGPGRPLRSAYVATADDFRARVFPIIQELAANGTNRPRQAQVCKWITASWPEYRRMRATQDSACDPGQLHRWFTTLGWTDWNAVLDEALSGN